MSLIPTYNEVLAEAVRKFMRSRDGNYDNLFRLYHYITTYIYHHLTLVPMLIQAAETSLLVSLRKSVRLFACYNWGDR